MKVRVMFEECNGFGKKAYFDDCFSFGVSGDRGNSNIRHVSGEGISLRVCRAVASGSGGETERMLVGEHATICEN